MAMEKSIINGGFNGKIHYFYGHVPLLFVCSPEGICDHQKWFHDKKTCISDFDPLVCMDPPSKSIKANLCAAQSPAADALKSTSDTWVNVIGTSRSPFVEHLQAILWQFLVSLKIWSTSQKLRSAGGIDGWILKTIMTNSVGRLIPHFRSVSAAPLQLQVHLGTTKKNTTISRI